MQSQPTGGRKMSKDINKKLWEANWAVAKANNELLFSFWRWVLWPVLAPIEKQMEQEIQEEGDHVNYSGLIAFPKQIKKSA
jgi:hypothetical protein